MAKYGVIVKVFGLRRQDISNRNIVTFETKVENIFFAETVYYTFIEDKTIELENIPILIEVKFKNKKQPGKDLESLLIKASSESFPGRQEEAIVDF
ncbi:MAG: hypothetical protein PHY72_03740 [Candidatus Pacebacteria bacterium]|nr:hypothetical protein [Candidatus Paceibacterota bacterium]